MLGVSAGGGRPLLLRGSEGITPGNFLRFLMPNPAFGEQFGPENKLIEGQPNEYDVICPERLSVSVPPVANDRPICRSAVPAPKFHRVPTPLLFVSEHHIEKFHEWD